MASTRRFVILFLVYLNFDISPLHSAAIPKRFVNENDETATANYESFTTTGATDDDIEKIFESYENMYLKNSNWFNNDELLRNVNGEKSLKIKPEEESTSREELEATEPTTADDVVETIHNIIDEKIDTKKNRTDRTIVVVVTTNVFNINGSDGTSKRQHTLLSFGTPGMFQKEATSTDATLTMHNKITTEFFNNNPSPIIEKSATIKANDNQKSIVENSKAIDLEDSKVISRVAEDDVSTTENPDENRNVHGITSNIDIRKLYDDSNIESSLYTPTVPVTETGRNLDDTLSDDDSNDVLRLINFIPNRSADDTKFRGLSKPFELPDQERDSSLMKAIENILDTDVRKAFERDIPQIRHVPLDITIEEEALYAPLKDLSEYIVEELPTNRNYDIHKQNLEVDDRLTTLINTKHNKSFGELKELRSDSTERVVRSIFEPVVENEQRSNDAPTTTEEPATSTIEERSAVTDEAATEKAVTDEAATSTTDEFESKTIRPHFDDIEESMTTTTSNDFDGETKTLDSTVAKLVDEIESENLEGVSKMSKTDTETNTYLPTKQIISTSLRTVEAADTQLRQAMDKASQSLLGAFEMLEDISSNHHMYVDPAATAIPEIGAPADEESFVNTPNTLLAMEEKLKEVELPKTFSHVDIDKNVQANFIEEIGSTTPKPEEEDVVSQVVKVNEETTEQHQIIKKPGVDDVVIDDSVVEIKPIKVTNVETNDLATEIPQGRSFSDNDDPVDPLQTLVEGVQLTAEITKAIDSFQSFNDPNDSIHFAANQVIKNQDDMEVVSNVEELNSADDTVWSATAKYVYIGGGILLIGLIVMLVIVSFVRFRQFKRNILFTC